MTSLYLAGVYTARLCVWGAVLPSKVQKPTGEPVGLTEGIKAALWRALTRGSRVSDNPTQEPNSRVAA